MLPALNRISLDSEQAEQASDGSVDTLAEQFPIITNIASRSGKRFQDGDWQAGGAAWCINGDLGCITQPLDARAVLLPGFSPLRPQLCLRLCIVGWRQSLLARVVFIDPGLKILAVETWKGQHQVPEIPLRIDNDGGDVINRRFFEK